MVIMTNIEVYTDAFKRVFEVSDNTSKIESLKYQEIPEWDSVGHMELVSEIEDAFDIELETEDIIEFSSYQKGKEILAVNYGIDFTA